MTLKTPKDYQGVSTLGNHFQNYPGFTPNLPHFKPSAATPPCCRLAATAASLDNPTAPHPPDSSTLHHPAQPFRLATNRKPLTYGLGQVLGYTAAREARVIPL
ncbi:hypothetical protein PCANC_18495 [Puccinia coronata f. sp. avenae]|uniref:Uncharacterized protein n=1 Tax=Puccinia coronata f. sp. avenae TaxID=200324 RepID=A0A2N5T1G7_9BASI|nr:hypothetical protein PCANC_18495 [Puccinia coronata f. sp. avenae]